GAAPGPAAGPFSAGNAGLTVAILVLVTLVAFESMAVSTAMPAVAQDLDAVRSYGLAFSVMLTGQLLGIVLAGVWSDRAGPLPGTFVGQALLAGGSAVCAVADRLDVFLVGRALTGLGGGLLVVMLYVIAGRVFPESVRPRFFALVSAAWVLPSLLGPPLTAWLTSTWSWRVVFWLVVAPVLVTGVTMARLRGRVETGTLQGGFGALDTAAHVRAARSGLVLALAAAAVQWGTTDLRTPWSAATLLAAVGLLGVGVAAPRLLPRGTFAMARGLPSVMLARGGFTAVFIGAASYLPLMLTSERGTTLGQAGIILSLGSFGWAAGSWVQGRARMDGRRPLLVSVAGALLVTGIGLLAALSWLGLPTWLAVPAMVFAGLAMGLGVTSTTVLSLELTPVEEHGPTSSSLQLSDVLGSVMGVAAANAVFATLHRGPGLDAPVYTVVFGGLAALAGVCVAAGRRIRT
ncbi:MAG TPA: MFS transporter, partial [Dermatophilaceae bacterium]|nr:MFS transporter [Dermatophilaceae bacterium]